jgi:hypothetical protein
VSEDLSRAPNLYFTLLLAPTRPTAATKTPKYLQLITLTLLQTSYCVEFNDVIISLHGTAQVVVSEKEMFYTASPDVVVTLAFDYQQGGSWVYAGDLRGSTNI